MIFVTDSITVSDVNALKLAMDDIKSEAEQAGAKDLKVFKSINNPNKVLTTAWWPSHDALHEFEGKIGPSANAKIESIKQSDWDEDAWEEI
ncbi:hypothetical protein A2773_02850 [Candidatus Gottesmanbacteria bacterium RIFCSPHIGHO2_01_FULL_39_10]|uniref:ABM domain-containing protein n=1 Tax=Candidatus Gottesmanbacteria bacterium RIFCSPHIGHO2_01_FULL_39_10 TaxID=1798375 RepID=A0A1F5ZMG7_9BACT|nr:MAG: hypothetical protein A2773_02850 [Candidatus Gottesmanbacteria bacterium RIFCSPHIGHO2_01_FULL_39_10]